MAINTVSKFAAVFVALTALPLHNADALRLSRAAVSVGDWVQHSAGEGDASLNTASVQQWHDPNCTLLKAKIQSLENETRATLFKMAKNKERGKVDFLKGSIRDMDKSTEKLFKDMKDKHIKKCIRECAAEMNRPQQQQIEQAPRVLAQAANTVFTTPEAGKPSPCAVHESASTPSAPQMTPEEASHFIQEESLPVVFAEWLSPDVDEDVPVFSADGVRLPASSATVRPSAPPMCEWSNGEPVKIGEEVIYLSTNYGPIPATVKKIDENGIDLIVNIKNRRRTRRNANIENIRKDPAALDSRLKPATDLRIVSNSQTASGRRLHTAFSFPERAAWAQSINITKSQRRRQREINRCDRIWAQAAKEKEM